MIAPNDLVSVLCFIRVYYGGERIDRSKTESIDSAITVILRGTRTKGNTDSCRSKHDLIKVK